MQSIEGLQSDQIVERSGVRGTVTSRTGPKVNGRILCQSVRIEWSNGLMETYDHFMPDEIKIIA